MKEFIRKSLRESLGVDEDIDIADDRLSFDYNKHDRTHINTALGKSSKNLKFQPRVTTLKNSRVKVISVYSKKSGADTTEILKALKRSSGYKYDVDNPDYDAFIKRTAIFFSRYLKNNSIDTIIAMTSSSSLVNDIVAAVRERLPDLTIKVYTDSIHKNIDNLTIEKGALSDDEYQSLVKSVEKAKASGNFQIKKFSGKHRRFLRNWIEVNEDIIKDIEDKNVVLFDDYITSGATLDEVCSTLLQLSPKSLEALTIIKG